MQSAADASLVPEPGDRLTAGSWRTEAESASALDDRLLSAPLSDLFNIYIEVPGTLTQPRPGQVDKTVRIDRVLVPKPEAMLNGWQHGAVGIEVKRSSVPMGPGLSQAMDYTRSVWRIRGVLIQLDAVFLWPGMELFGPLLSVITQHRVGTAETTPWTPFRLRLGQTILECDDAGACRMADYRSGRKVGSR